jgi:hypothetical protein
MMMMRFGSSRPTTSTTSSSHDSHSEQTVPPPQDDVCNLSLAKQRAVSKMSFKSPFRKQSRNSNKTSSSLQIQASLHPYDSSSLPLSPLHESKLQLMPKIAAYRAQGLLTGAQEQDLYRDLKHVSSNNPFDTRVLSDIESKLQQYSLENDDAADAAAVLKRDLFPEKQDEEEPPQEEEPQDVKSSTNDHQELFRAPSKKPIQIQPLFNKTTSAERAVLEKILQRAASKSFDKSVDSALSNHTSRQQSLQQQQQQDSPQDDTVSESQFHLPTVIMDPSQLYNQVPTTLLQRWFCEMCFFARLGFLQPPCCLQCLHHEAMHQGVHTHCQNMVLWRRNANHKLHPDTLHTPKLMLLVPCTAAKALTEGQVVQNDYYWDGKQRRLIQLSQQE